MSATGLKQRLAAILAADVAGYSRLMAGDDLATVAALDRARTVFCSTDEIRPRSRCWRSVSAISRFAEEARERYCAALARAGLPD